MDPIVLANLLAQLLPLGIQVYTQIQQANSGTVKPIEEILANADVNFDSVIAAAQKQLNP
jgi:hypothetical protein